VTNQYITNEVCSRSITFEVVNGLVHNVEFVSGCPGNLQAIGRLVEGMAVEEAIKRLKGIACAGKTTSCPDQLALALEKYQEQTTGTGVVQ
jgi:uncharacterized protein (TIGR03905 family)